MDRLATLQKVYTVLLAGSCVAFVKTDPVATQDCPAVFTYGTSIPIIYKIHSTGITHAKCLAASRVVFNFRAEDKTGESTCCSRPYPPASCHDFNTSDTCGCIKKEAADYTYKYTFPVDGSHLRGRIKAGLCYSPEGPYTEKVSPSCKSITFHADLDAVETKCPTFFKQGENDVTCTIKSALITRECNGTEASTVQFALTLKGMETQGCSPNPLYNKSGCTSGDGATCGCRSMSGDTLTYFLKFHANESVHDGGSLRCKIGFSSGLPSIGPECPTAFEPKSVDNEGSSSSNLGLIIGVTAGSVVLVAMAIGAGVWGYKKRSSSGHNVQSNTRPDTPPPAVGSASHSADRGLAATSDLEPTGDDASESDVDSASEASDVSEITAEP